MSIIEITTGVLVLSTGIIAGLYGVYCSDKTNNVNMNIVRPLHDKIHKFIPYYVPKAYADIPIALSLLFGLCFMFTLEWENMCIYFLKISIAICILNVIRPFCYCSTILPSPDPYNDVWYRAHQTSGHHDLMFSGHVSHSLTILLMLYDFDCNFTGILF